MCPFLLSTSATPAAIAPAPRASPKETRAAGHRHCGIIVHAGHDERKVRQPLVQSGDESPRLIVSDKDVGHHRRRHMPGSPYLGLRNRRCQNWLKFRIPQKRFEFAPSPRYLRESEPGPDGIPASAEQTIRPPASPRPRKPSESTNESRTFPGSLSSQMFPPSSMARFRQSGNPSPVPRCRSCSGLLNLAEFAEDGFVMLRRNPDPGVLDGKQHAAHRYEVRRNPHLSAWA